MPRLSVVIPSYNNVQHIDAAVGSVLDQDFDDFELIIADHSSTDGTWEALQRYAAHDRVTLVRTEAGGGAERNFNRVSELSTGTYLKLLPGDDLLKPGVLRRQVALLDAHPEATVVACAREFIDTNGATLMKSRGLSGIRRPMSGRDVIVKVIRAGSNLLGEPGAVTIRRDVLAEDGFWFFEFPFLVDQATYLRALVHGGFVPDLETGAAFRMSAGQWSVALTKQQSTQVHAFHRWMREHHPDIVSDSDVRWGNVQASIMARLRRLSYAILKNRMT